MQSETLAQEFARLVKEYHEGDDHTKPEAWNLLADYAVDNAEAISAALSDKQAGEVSCIACEGRPSAGNNPCAVCGRSALVDVPAVERKPAGYLFELFYPGSDRWSGQMFSDHDPAANLPAEHVRNVRPLYAQPPLSEGTVVPMAELEKEIASVVQSVNEWDDRTSPDDYPEHLLITSDELADILRNFSSALAATRSASATSPKGCE